jgi:hypothetical protein
LADCEKYRTFPSYHGLQALPAFHLYPENIRSHFPFAVEYADNKTVSDYVADIDAIRLRTSDMYGDLTAAASSAAKVIVRQETALATEAAQRQRLKQERIEAAHHDRRVRMANRTYTALLEAHNRAADQCAAASLELESEQRGCSGKQPPNKPKILIQAEAAVAAAAVAAEVSPEGLDPAIQHLASSPANASQPVATSVGPSSHTTGPDDTLVNARQQVAQAKAPLLLRLKRLEMFERFLADAEEQGSGAVVRALNVRAANVYSAVVKQFLDKDHRDTVLLEMSALYALADELAATMDSAHTHATGMAA